MLLSDCLEILQTAQNPKLTSNPILLTTLLDPLKACKSPNRGAPVTRTKTHDDLSISQQGVRGVVQISTSANRKDCIRVFCTGDELRVGGAGIAVEPCFTKINRSPNSRNQPMIYLLCLPSRTLSSSVSQIYMQHHFCFTQILFCLSPADVLAYRWSITDTCRDTSLKLHCTSCSF